MRPSIIANQFSYIYPTNTTPFPTIVVGGSLTDTYPTAAPSTPNGVGPGLVLAEDNTLGPFSPYQGRIYAAFVGYFNVSNPRDVKNPTTNTDIFLVYSDDGGRTWSSPELVNDDQATTDGYSQANDKLNPDASDQITGRTQFQPEIAVDQSTGTVVISWRDARNDAANARVATYITTSIDGGNTFGPQTYANPPETAVDAITGQTNIIGPASDDESSRNGQRDADLRLRQPDGPGRRRWTALPDLGGQLLRSHCCRDPRQLLQHQHERSQRLPSEHLVPADDHRGRAANHLQHDGTGDRWQPLGIVGRHRSTIPCQIHAPCRFSVGNSHDHP